MEFVHPDFLSFEVFCFEVEPHYFCSCIFHDSFGESWEGNSFHRLVVGIQLKKLRRKSWLHKHYEEIRTETKMRYRHGDRKNDDLFNVYIFIYMYIYLSICIYIYTQAPSGPGALHGSVTRCQFTTDLKVLYIISLNEASNLFPTPTFCSWDLISFAWVTWHDLELVELIRLLYHRCSSFLDNISKLYVQCMTYITVTHRHWALHVLSKVELWPLLGHLCQYLDGTKDKAIY